MDKIIKKYKINYVWHFTDKANMSLIEENGGLLSLRNLKQRGVELPCCGGNEWSQNQDFYKGLDRYVHLAFTDDHPMQYCAVKEHRFDSPIWLKIDSSVILDRRVKFCAGVANKTGAVLLESRQASRRINFNALYDHTDLRNPEKVTQWVEARKSEILVPDFIKINNIIEYKHG